MSYTSIPSDATDYYNVYHGVWINWSRGPVFGATITMTRRDGALLIAFIALFVTLVGTSFWRLSCFTLHYIYSTEVAQDGLYHQRQAILRNSANGASGLWRLGQSLYKWQASDKGAYRRLAPLIILTVVVLISFGAASGLSSNISSAIGNEVLVVGARCGMPSRMHAKNAEQRLLVRSYLAEQANLAANYAKQCYSNTSNPESCQGYVQKKLDIYATKNASCPFDSGICRSENRNLILDTGFLDSHDDLGVNTPPSLRLQHRAVMHCAPLHTSRYEEIRQYNDTYYLEVLVAYLLGDAIIDNRTSSQHFFYEYPFISIPEIDSTAGGRYHFEYTLYSSAAWVKNGDIHLGLSDFYPIPELRDMHSDLTLFFLSSNGIDYTDEIDDDWYSAHRRHNINVLGQDDVGYLQDTPASVLGCKWQEQWCKDNGKSGRKCMPLSGLNDVFNRLVDFTTDIDEIEFALWMFFMRMTVVDSVYKLVNILGVSMLTSRDSLISGLQGPLPDDQWQIDVEHWLSTYLAALQKGFVDFATGPSDPHMAPFLLMPYGNKSDTFCKKQKIRSNGSTNISVFGLCTILIVGGIVVILSYTIEPLLEYIRKRRNLDVYARLEWCANDTLQLQRLAHEGIGVGTWGGCDGDFPITAARQRLAVLDVDDPTHPRLKAPPKTFDEALKGAEQPHSINHDNYMRGTGEASSSIADAVKQSHPVGDMVTATVHHSSNVKAHLSATNGNRRRSI